MTSSNNSVRRKSIQIPQCFLKDTEFRHIELENGLQALLVRNFDPNFPQHENAPKETHQSLTANVGATSAEPIEDEPTTATPENADSAPTPLPGDTSTKCLAALNVHAGFYQDHFPGNAHFLEHLLFCGSERFPHEDHYANFLKKFAGEHNAMTANEDTTYFFDISVPSEFEGALDIFSRFFIDPLLNSDTIKRELKAIDSEFSNALQNDAWRLMQIVRSQGETPFSKFGAGNSETILGAFHTHEPDKEKLDTIRDTLKSFFETHYSSHKMHLVLMSSDHSLDQLETLAVKYFSPIRRRATPDTHNTPFPFARDQLPLRINITPVRDLRSLSFFFPCTWKQSEYKYQPLRYWSHILTDKSEGSLFAQLFENGWINSLDVSSMHSLSHTDMYCFEMLLKLTETGEQHEDDICHYVFQYLLKLKSEGPSFELWKEAQGLSEIEFHHSQEKITNYEYAAMLAKNMSLYEPEHILSGPIVYFEYNEASLRNILNQLTPENVIIISQSQRHTTDRVEKFYGGAHTIATIPADQLERAQVVDPSLSFRLPQSNPYIPDSLELFDVPSSVTDEPQLLLSTHCLDLWWLQDKEFRRPKDIMLFSFLVDGLCSDIMKYLYAHILLTAFNQTISGKITHAEKAQLSFHMTQHNRGYDCVFYGFSQKLGLLAEEVFHELNRFIVTEEEWPAALDQIVRSLSNNSKEMPVYQLLHHADNVLYSQHFSFHELLEASKCVSYSQFQHFVSSWRSVVKTRVLIVGNCTRERALALSQIAKDATPNQKAPDNLERPQIVQLKTNTDYFYQIEAENENDANSSIIVLYQLGLSTTSTDVMSSLYGKIVSSPFFDRLRTQEMCGYIVQASPMRKHNTMWLCFLAQSAEKDPMFILSRIEKFLVDFHETICNMSEDEFEQHKDGLIQQMLKKDDGIPDVSSRIWKEIERETFDFHRRERYAKACANFTLDELRAFSAGLSTRSRLVLQLFSSKDKDKKGEIVSQEAKDQVFFASREELREVKKHLPTHPHQFSSL